MPSYTESPTAIAYWAERFTSFRVIGDERTTVEHAAREAAVGLTDKIYKFSDNLNNGARERMPLTLILPNHGMSV